MASRLKSLALSGNSLGPGFDFAIEHGSQMAELESLELDGCELGPQGFRAILESSRTPQRRRLNVNHNSIGEEFFRLFQTDSSFDYISAAGNKIPDMMESHYLKNQLGYEKAKVISLDLHSNQLGDGFARFLSSGPYFESLRTLNLASNAISSAGAELICQSPHLQNLQQVQLSSYELSETAKERLRLRFGSGLILS